LTLIAWLQLDEEPAVVQRRAESGGTHEGVDVGDVGIVLDDLRRHLLVIGHRLERGVLRPFGESEDLAGILAREEALRDR
jgi:hypothetical protein